MEKATGRQQVPPHVGLDFISPTNIKSQLILFKVLKALAPDELGAPSVAATWSLT
jgi:hypothetical protein